MVREIWATATSDHLNDSKSYLHNFASVIGRIEQHMETANNGSYRNLPEWIQGMEDRRWDSIFSLILMLLSEVKIIGSEQRLDWPWATTYGSMFRFDLPGRMTFGTGHIARSLTKVSVAPSEDVNVRNTLSDIMRVGQLDHIEEMSLRFDDLPIDYMPLVMGRCLTKKLSLSLWHWRHEVNGIERLLVSFSLPRDLCLDLLDPSCKIWGVAVVNPIQVIIRMVHTIGLTELKTLTLRLPYVLTGFLPPTDENSLVAFADLSSINVPAFDSWVGKHEYDHDFVPRLGTSIPTRHGHLTPIADLIPGSTTDLTFSHASRITIFHVWDFLKYKGSRFSKFKVIVLQFDDDYTSKEVEEGNEDRKLSLEGDMELLRKQGLVCGVDVSFTRGKEMVTRAR